MDWSSAEKLAGIYGDSFFVFDQCKFENNFRNLSEAFTGCYSNTRIAYSYKTNYTPDICRLVDRLGGYAEVVSEMEYGLAKRLGVKDDRIVYNGPYKSTESMHAALLGGAIVNIDSLHDFKIAALASCEAAGSVRLALRCNFPIDDDLQSRFGFDVEGDDFRTVIGAIKNSANLRLAGLHCHFPNRDLSSYAARTKRMLELTRTIFSEPPEFINIGGGFFGEMPDALKNSYKFPLPTFSDYAQLIGPLFNEAFGSKKPILFIEPGTALVANTFSFYTKVISLKDIRGRRIATVSGSIFNISPVARSTNLPVTILNRLEPVAQKGEKLSFAVAGYTCIESDYLSKLVEGFVEEGDFLVYNNVGSYSIVMKPPFILPNWAILKTCDNGVKYSVVREKETPDYIFGNFVSY
jgi:diaminopimelate decarboxylase